jgi:hypothetical protein
LEYIAPARAEPYVHDVVGACALSPVTLATQCLTALYVAFACAIIGGQSAPRLGSRGQNATVLQMRISDKRTTDCQRQVWMSTDAHGLFMTSRGRVVLFVVSLAIIAAVAIFGRVYGQHLAYDAMQDRDSAIRQLELQSQRLELEKSSQSADMQSQHVQMARLQAQLDAITPSQNRYNINPNQSLLVADGHLTVGLVGVPKSDGLDMNIDGKRQTAAVGDVIHVAPDPSTTCDVKIQSFDMFKAQFTASCAAAKTE